MIIFFTNFLKYMKPKKNNGHQNNIVIYTAIFNKYDTLRKPPKCDGCDFVCFTDDPNMRSDTYDIRVNERVSPDPTRDARMYKILPHKFFPEYEYSIWLDGSRKFKKKFNPQKAVEKYLKENKIAAFNHSERNCVYDEFDICLEQKKDSTDVIKKQKEKYLKESYPKENGLVDSAFLIRKHNDIKIIEFDEKWWDELSKASRRDQLSFNYAAHKTNTKYTRIKGDIFNNEYFFYTGHNGLEQKYETIMKHIEMFFKKKFNITLPSIRK